MALSFFRKHRKYFIVLMAAAVFAMVTWGALSMGPDAWAVVKTWITGENPRNPTVLRVYGEGVTRSEWWTTRFNLETGTRLLGFIQELKRLPGDQRLRAWQLARAMERHVTQGTVLGRYAETRAIEDETVRDEAQAQLVTAAVALLHEAKRAGVTVTDDMVDEHLREWEAAGLTVPIQNALKVNVFAGAPQWQYYLHALLRQEMTLSIYLEAAARDAMILKEDVDNSFRRISEKVDVATVALKAGDFADKVAEPSEDAIAEQYEKYRDNLPGQDGRPFGYKIPDRIQFKYLVVDSDVVAKDVVVTDEDVKDYYEKNKDRLYVVEEKKDEKTDDGKDGKKVDETEGEQKSEGGERGDSTPSDEEPAKTLDAPEAAPDEGPDAPEPAAGQDEPAPPAAPDETVEDKPEAAADRAESQPPEAEEPEAEATPEKPEKPKTYKPLEDVREEIEKQLRQARIRDLTGQKAAEALDRLKQQPRLSLENVADGKVVKVYQSKGFVTAEEAREAEGIGASYGLSSGRGGWMGFASLAFSIAPLAEEPEIYLRRPVGVLYGMENGDQYIFSVTAVEPAHQPTSLDEVREQVVADLKKMAGYAAAVGEARAILDEAREDGLAKTAEARKLTVETTTLSATSLGRDPLAETVFEAVDAGETLGKVESDHFDDVTVFEISAVEHGKETRYLLVRGRLTDQVIDFRRQVFKRWFTKPEMVIKRCGLTETDEPIDARKKKADSVPTAPAGSPLGW